MYGIFFHRLFNNIRIRTFVTLKIINKALFKERERKRERCSRGNSEYRLEAELGPQ